MTQTVLNDGDSAALFRAALNTMFGELYTGKVKVNFAATSAPLVTDDSDSGYAAGSAWLRIDTGDFYRCRDASVGAAKWQKFNIAEHPGYIVGHWYRANNNVTAATGIALSNGTIRCIPFQLKQRITISDIGCVLNTASGGNNLSLAIYANNPATGRPTGTALAATGSLSTTATGHLSDACAGGNKQFESGMYWTAINADNAVAAVQSVSNTSVWGTYLIGSASTSIMGPTANVVGFTVTTPSAYVNGWIDLTAAVWTEVTTSSAPILQFKVASVP